MNYFSETTPDPAAAALKLTKAKLAAALIDEIERRGWSQARSSRELSSSQPRMNRLFRGYLGGITVEFLLLKLHALGIEADVHLVR